MEAQLKKIVIQPPKLNPQGEQTRPEVAILTFESPIDSPSQRLDLYEIFGLLATDWLDLTVMARQLRLPKEASLDRHERDSD
jgi:hypothetical protein